MKMINLKFQNKSGTQAEMLISDDTIKRIVKRKRLVTIATPIFPRGFKNQVIFLSKENFDYLMEQLNDN